MLIDDFSQKLKLTPQEQAIVDYIINNPDFIEKCTARDLATASFTSAPTVTRLCQKLGFSGFPEFRLRFVSEQRASKRNLFADLSKALVTSGSSAEELHRALPQFYNSIIYETSAHLDPDKLDSLKNLVLSASAIDIYATGMNYHIASRAAFHFQTLGISCCALDEANVHMLERLTPSDRRLSFLLSHTGSNCKIVEIATILTDLRLATVAITESASSPLAGLADTTIELFSTPAPDKLSLLSYSISLSYVFDLLYTVLLAEEIGGMFTESSTSFYSSLEKGAPATSRRRPIENASNGDCN